MLISDARFCEECEINVSDFHTHQNTINHKNNCCTPMDDHVQMMHTAFKSRIASYRITSPRQHIIVREFMNDIWPKFHQLIQEQLDKLITIKVNTELFGNYFLQTKDITDIKSFRTKNVIITKSTDLEQYYEDLIQVLNEKLSEFLERDSGEFLKKN